MMLVHVAFALLCALGPPGRPTRPVDSRGARPVPAPGPQRAAVGGNDLDAANNRNLNKVLITATSAAEILLAYTANRDWIDDVNLSTAWNRLGKAHIPLQHRRDFFTDNRRVLEDMRHKVDAAVPRLPPRNLAGVAYGIARLGYRASHSTMDLIARTASEQLERFKPQEVANIAWAFAKANVRAPQLFAAIARVAVGRLDKFKPQELANTAWAFARAAQSAPPFFSAIATQASPQLPLFKAQELVNLAWAFSTLREPAPRLFDEIAAQARMRTHEFNSQELGNLAWAFAKADHPSASLFDAIAVEAGARLSEFKPQELSNTAWAFATAGAHNAALFAALASEAAPRLSTFKTQEVANTAWAFATAAIDAPQLYAACARSAVGRLHEFRTQEIANTLWAFATVGFDSPALFAAAAREVRARADEFNTQELTNVAWAMAKRGACVGVEERDAFFEAVRLSTLWRVLDFRPQGMANMAWAFATANAASSVALLRLFERELVVAGIDEQLEAFKAQEIANLAWACATMGADTPLIFEAIARLAPHRISDFALQDVVNTAWAFAVAGELRPTLAAALVSRLTECAPESIGLEAACQLHQFNMALRLDQPRFKPDPLDARAPRHLAATVARGAIAMPEPLARLALNALVVQAPLVSSNLHLDVSDALRRLGVAHINEQCVAVAGYHCDIAVGPDPAAEPGSGFVPSADAVVVEPACEPVSEQMGALRSVIVEVNGPWHYLPSDQREPKPASATKIRHLRALGWQVVEIPYWEWEHLEGSRDKQVYVADKLASVSTAAERRARALPRGAGATASRPKGAAVEPAAARGAAGSARPRTAATGAVASEAARAVAPAASGGGGGGGGGGWDSETLAGLVSVLVGEVKGFSPRKGEALLAHAAERMRAGRDLSTLSPAEWQCPGVGEVVATKVHGLTFGADPERFRTGVDATP